MKYRIHIVYSAEDEGYIATVPELPGCSAFGETIDLAAQEIRVAADAWLATAKELKREIPAPSVVRPYSGRLLLRMPSELHRSLDEIATDAGVSLNQYIVYLLARALGRFEIAKLSEDWSDQIDAVSRKAWGQFCRATSKAEDDRQWQIFRDLLSAAVQDRIREEHGIYRTIPSRARAKKS